MKLLVLGATGRTGQHIVGQALDAGHDVTVMARDPAKAPAGRERLRIVDGDAQNGAALSSAMRGQDAVVSAIGRGQSFKSERLIERTVPGLIAAMKSDGIKRLMFMSALGVGDTYRDAPIVAKLFFTTLLRGIYADKLIGDQQIRNSDLDWTIVQPVVLTDGPLTKNYRSGERLPLTGMPKISRADTAHFIVDRLSDSSTIRKTLIVSAG
jgi:putative NADH-flavin reductase